MNDSGIIRETPDVPEARSALVQQLTTAVREAKAHHLPAFKRMREDMKFARGLQWPGQTTLDGEERAVVDIIQRHLNSRVASLYAKNPTFVAKRRKRMDFAMWDGDAGALQRAAESQAMGVIDPTAVALMLDVQEGITRRRMLDRVGRTMEIVLDYSLDEQQPSFKARAKRLVRRSLTCGVSYVKVAYQRELEARPDVAARLEDITAQLATFERLKADLQDGQSDEFSADMEALTVVQGRLMEEQDVVVREGLVLDFPAATRIIPDLNTTELVGFVGSEWVAEEYLLSEEEVKGVYGVDLGGTYKGYTQDADGAATTTRAKKDRKALVWEVHHRKHGTVYVVCDGYPDFLKEPAPPPVRVEQFYPWFPLVLNDQEAEDELFPRSDVRLLRSTQREINRKREAIRQHRIASRPRYLGQRGKFEDAELKELSALGDHEVLFSNALSDGEKLEEVIQPLPKQGLDPNLYETGTDLTDVQLIVGASEAQMGNPQAKNTATGDAIAEQSRVSSVQSNIDDLDDLLTAIARSCGDILLSEMDAETVKKIVGPGASWPELDRASIAEDVHLEIEAGSSGRPNQAQDIANFERVAPTLMQIPGVSPDFLARHGLKILDSTVDFEEAITAGLPSIVSMNQATQPGTGDPATDPASQGPQGGQNAPQTDQSSGGPQPAMPTDPAATQGGVG